MANDKDDDDEVGYCKPPRHTRFKAGQSGNPSGRPKGSVNFNTAFMREASKKVAVVESGVRVMKTKVEVVSAQLWNLAMKGDPKAMAMVVPLAQRAATDGSGGAEAPDAQVTREVTGKYLLQILKAVKDDDQTEERSDEPTNE